MSAFLFIPATLDSRSVRRVDFANIASLFAEAEEPVRRGGGRRNLVRLAAAALLVMLAIGDTLMVAHPGILSPPRTSVHRTM